MLKEIYEVYPVLARAIFGVLFFFLGGGIGSFLGVVVSRSGRGESWTGGRSRCESCGHSLRWYDLIPVLSQLFMRSKCSHCGGHYSWTYVIPEAILGGLYALGGCIITDLPKLIIFFLLAGALAAASMFDFRTGLVPDGCSAIIAAAGLTVFVASFFDAGFFDRYSVPWHEHLIGAVAVGGPFLIICLLGGMGMGDVFIMSSSGFLLGWKNIVTAAFIGIFIGAAEGIFLKITGIKEPDNPETAALKAALEKVDSPDWISPSEAEMRGLTRSHVNESEDRRDAATFSANNVENQGIKKSDTENDSRMTGSEEDKAQSEYNADITVSDVLSGESESSVSGTQTPRRVALSEYVDRETERDEERKKIRRELEDALAECEREKPKGTMFRFVPALSVGIIIAYFCGEEVFSWYSETILHI